MKQDRTLYIEKKLELNFFIDSLIALYGMNDIPLSPYTSFLSEKIKSKEKYNLEEFLVILKSNSFVMMYNIVESTVKNSIDYLYTEINSKNMKYVDACEEIRKIWFNHHFNENTVNIDKIRGISQDIVNDIIGEVDIFLDFEKFKISGNADVRKIRAVLCNHGMEIDFSKTNVYAGSLLTVKNKRNSLAHGSESFIDSAKDFSEKDIQNFSVHVFKLLEFVMDEVDIYVQKESYKM